MECCDRIPNRCGEFCYPNGEKIPLFFELEGWTCTIVMITESSISIGGQVLCIHVADIIAVRYMVSCRKYSTDLLAHGC